MTTLRDVGWIFPKSSLNEYSQSIHMSECRLIGSEDRCFKNGHSGQLHEVKRFGKDACGL